MKTDDLKAKGLSEEQISFVMAENGKDLKALQDENATLKTEKSQLENDKKVLEKEKGEKEKALADLQKNTITKEEYDSKIKEIEGNAKKEKEEYIYNDLLGKGLDSAKVRKDEKTRAAFISLLDREKIKISDDKKSLIGLKEQTDAFKKEIPHFFETKSSGYSPAEPEGGKGDEDGEISMASDFANEANKSEEGETKSLFFN